MKLGPRCYKQTSSSIFLTTQDETQLFIVHVTNSTVLFQHHSLPLERCSLEFHKMWWLSSHQIHSVYTCQNLLSLRVPLGPATHCLVLDRSLQSKTPLFATLISSWNRETMLSIGTYFFFRVRKSNWLKLKKLLLQLRFFYRDMCVCI